MTQMRSPSNQRPTQIPTHLNGCSQAKAEVRDGTETHLNQNLKTHSLDFLSLLSFSQGSKRKRSAISNDDNDDNNNGKDNNQLRLWLGSIAEEANAEALSPTTPLSFSPSQIELNDFFKKRKTNTKSEKEMHRHLKKANYLILVLLLCA